MGLNNKTNKIGLSQILMSLILHRINVTHPNKFSNRNRIFESMFGLARVYCTALIVDKKDCK